MTVNKVFQIAVLEDSSYIAETKAYETVIKSSKGFKVTVWHGEKPYCCFKKTENPPKVYPNWFTERGGEVCVCSELGTEHLLWGFDRNGLQIREIKSMCSKSTVTFDGWNENQSFHFYFSILYTFLLQKSLSLFLPKLFSSVGNVLLSIWKYLWKSENSLYHVLPRCWYLVGLFLFVSLFYIKIICMTVLVSVS